MQGIWILAWLMDYRRGRRKEGRKERTNECRSVFGGKYSICQIQITQFKVVTKSTSGFKTLLEKPYTPYIPQAIPLQINL